MLDYSLFVAIHKMQPNQAGKLKHLLLADLRVLFSALITNI